MTSSGSVDINNCPLCSGHEINLGRGRQLSQDSVLCKLAHVQIFSVHVKVSTCDLSTGAVEPAGSLKPYGCLSKALSSWFWWSVQGMAQ